LRPFPSSGIAGKAQQTSKEPGEGNCYFEVLFNATWAQLGTRAGARASARFSMAAKAKFRNILRLFLTRTLKRRKRRAPKWRPFGVSVSEIAPGAF
jgi:hypothetical protein